MIPFIESISTLKKYTQLRLLNCLRFDKYLNISYSQEGEDLILKRIFDGQKSGMFVDVGAHHPKRFSNTYLFYLQGWRGINIDAMPGSMIAFNKIRPEDINIECPISDKEEELIYYIFNEPALNTLSKLEAEKKDGLNGFKIIERKKIFTNTLANVLSQNIKTHQQIDFLSIDVEGFDLNVLKSNDWDKYKPKVILVEELNCDLELILEKGSVTKYMHLKGYKLYAKSVNTLFFLLQE